MSSSPAGAWTQSQNFFFLEAESLLNWRLTCTFSPKLFRWGNNHPVEEIRCWKDSLNEPFADLHATSSPWGTCSGTVTGLCFMYFFSYSGLCIKLKISEPLHQMVRDLSCSRSKRCFGNRQLPFVSDTFLHFPMAQSMTEIFCHQMPPISLWFPLA